MHTIFHTTITQIGGCARDALLDNMRFDGEAEAEFPGSIHVSGPTPTDIPLGSTLSFIA